MTSLSLQNYTVAVAGQPNTGKSTVFNLLTGLNQQVGNWAGKTIEKSMGKTSLSEGGYTVVDLPGTYSLNARSEEERIAASFITESQANLVVIVANAASPERTLYYALDVMLLGKPCIIALNMMDVAKANGKEIDILMLEKTLGIPVIPLIATKGAKAHNKNERNQFGVLRACIQERLEKPVAMHDITRQLEAFLSAETREYFHTLATALHERSGQAFSEEAISEKKARCIAWQALESNAKAVEIISEHCSDLLTSLDIFFEDTQQARYAWLGQAIGEPSTVSAARISLTRRFDKWLLHPFWGTIAMFFILIGFMFIGFIIGFPLAIQVLTFLRPIEIAVVGFFPVDFPLLQGMTKGVFRGLSAVSAMFPFIFSFYGVFAVLEDIGYMNRAALLMDRLMRRIGLNGKAFVPFLMALPCTIAGVMACRSIETPRAKTLVLLLIPLVPCGAKIVVLFTLAAWIFPNAYGGLIVLGLCAINMLVLIILCKIFGLFVAKDVDTGMVMELPHYHFPNFRTVAQSVLSHCKSFLRKATTIIVCFSVVLWALSYYPTGNIDTSLLGQFGQFIAPVGNLMGVDWRLLTALLASFIGREAMLATIGITFNASPTELPEILRASLTPAAAIAFMCAQNLFFPCIATIGILFKEARSIWIIVCILLYTSVLPFIVGPLIFMLCSLIL